MPPTPSPGSSATQQFAQRPFIDPELLPVLYADQTRVRRRSRALLAAKIEGRHVGRLIAELLHTAAPNLTTEPTFIADIGCGTGHPTRTLAQRFPHARLLAIDASTQMLAAAHTHLHDHLGTDTHRITYLQADFHHLPLADAAYHAAMAVFCLYHSANPAQAIAEIARCLTPGGPAAATALTVETVLRDRHVFQFRDAHHLAEYLTTVPKYQFPESLRATPAALAADLRRRRGDGPATTTSTITCIIARQTPPP